MSSTIQTKARIATLTYIYHVTALRRNASFVADPYIDKKTAKSSIAPKQCSLHRPKATIATLNYIHHVTALTFATAAYNYSTSELQKVFRRVEFFNIFTGKCASFFQHFHCQMSFRHSSVQLFDIRSAQSAPKTRVFQHFHCPMC